MGWRPAGDGTMEPVCVGARPDGHKIVAIRDAEGRVVVRLSRSGDRPYMCSAYPSLNDALPAIKATAKTWMSQLREALAEIKKAEDRSANRGS